MAPPAGSLRDTAIPFRGATGPLLADRGRIHDHPFVRVGGGWRLRTADDGQSLPPLVVIPGLNDPLVTVGDSRPLAAAMAVYARRFARGRPVYFISRPHGPDVDRSIPGLAAGYARVIDELPSADRADLLGLSMGGFVAATLAAGYPDRVRRVALGLAADRLSPGGRRIVEGWMDHARRGDFGDIYLSGADLLASGATRLALRAWLRLYAALRDPVAPADFLAAARACLDHVADDLGSIRAPALVVGGTADPFFSTDAFRRTARAIPDGRLALLRGAGHEAVVEHGRTVEGVIRRFFRESGGT